MYFKLDVCRTGLLAILAFDSLPSDCPSVPVSRPNFNRGDQNPDQLWQDVKRGRPSNLHPLQGGPQGPRHRQQGPASRSDCP